MIFRKTVERKRQTSIVEKIVCSKCGADVTLVERTFDGEGRWDGGFLTGTIRPGLAARRGGLSADDPKIEIAWEFCAGCLEELRTWVGNDGDPSRGMKIPRDCIPDSGGRPLGSVDFRTSCAFFATGLSLW